MKSHRTPVAGRFKVDVPVLMVLLMCGFAIGAFVYREIRKNPFGLKTDIFPLHISAKFVEGLGFGSQLRCQGFIVGRVKEVRPNTVGDGLAFSIEARIDPKFSTWKFEDMATVRAAVGPSYLGLSAIELTYAGTMPRPEVQHLTLRHAEAPDFSTVQANAPKIVADVRDIVSTLNKPVSELAKLDPETATAAERIVINLHDTAERMSRASAELTEDEPENASTLHRLQGTVKDLQEASRDLKKASAHSVQLEEQLSRQVDSLSREMHLRLARVEYSAFQILGEKPAERLALGRDIRLTVANLRSASEQVNDLLPRVGDTFLGRLLIRRDKKKPPVKTRVVRIPVKPVQPVRPIQYRDQRDWKQIR